MFKIVQLITIISIYPVAAYALFKWRLLTFKPMFFLKIFVVNTAMGEVISYLSHYLFNNNMYFFAGYTVVETFVAINLFNSLFKNSTIKLLYLILWAILAAYMLYTVSVSQQYPGIARELQCLFVVIAASHTFFKTFATANTSLWLQLCCMSFFMFYGISFITSLGIDAIIMLAKNFYQVEYVMNLAFNTSLFLCMFFFIKYSKPNNTLSNTIINQYGHIQ